MGHKAIAAVIALGIATLFIPVGTGAWGVYSQPGYDEGRSIAAANDSVYVAGLSTGAFDGYRLLKYNASGDVAWMKQFPVPERRMTKEGYRHVAVAATSTSVKIAYTNGTCVIKAFQTNGTQLWETRWRRQCSVTDMAIAGNHTIVAGCADDGGEARYHVIAFNGQGTVAWNTSGPGRIYGVDVTEGMILAAGIHDGDGILISMDDTGGITGTRIIPGAAIRDVAATPDGIVLLDSGTGENFSLVTAPSVTGGNTTRHYHGRTAAGNALLAAHGRLFVAGSMYNQSSKSRDFLLTEYLPNGTFTDVIRHNANGSGGDVAWDAAEHDGVVATGAVYIQHIIPPNQVYINREIYTATYQPDNLPPSANVTWTPERPRANDHVNFTGTASDPDGSIMEWEWTFGDGATASRQNPIHVYTDKGVYTVILTVRDDDGATATATREIVIDEEEKTPGFSLAVACMAIGLAFAVRRRLTFK
ncbi:MAG: PKD domain-containing protein [Thermoplasmatota archaeon]